MVLRQPKHLGRTTSWQYETPHFPAYAATENNLKTANLENIYIDVRDREGEKVTYGQVKESVFRFVTLNALTTKPILPAQFAIS